MTIVGIITNCLKDESKTIKEIYDAVWEERPGTEESSVRGRLNENEGRLFKRIARGVYVGIRGPAVCVVVSGDAWQRVKDISDETIDAIITDPPYDWLDEHYKTGTTRKKSGALGYETQNVDSELLREMFRVLKGRKVGPEGHIEGGAHCFLFVPAVTGMTIGPMSELIEDAQNIGFCFNKLFVWDKLQIGMGYNGRNRYEGILFLSKGKRVMPGDMSIPDVLTYKKVHAEKRIHESEKPVALLQTLLRFSCQPGDVVLDLFGGSMSLGEAALNEGVNAILFEKNEQFLDDATRARNAYMQSSLLEF